MQNAFSRMEILLGEEGSTKLAKARIMVLALAALALMWQKRWRDAAWEV